MARGQVTQVSLKPPYEHVVLPLRRTALCFSIVGRHFNWRHLVVRFSQCRWPAIFAEVGPQRVRVCVSEQVAVSPAEAVPSVELGFAAKPAPDLTNCPAWPVGLRRHE